MITTPESIQQTVNKVWEPIYNTSQSFALDSRCDETLYFGTRGCGKSAIQLMSFRKLVGIGYGQFYKGIIFDQEHKNLGDIIAQSKKFFRLFDDGAKFLASASEYKWVWPTGEELLFRHAKKASDYDSYHGWEIPYIGYNELTKYPTGEFYDLMKSTIRCSFMPEKDTPVNKETGMYDTPDGMPLPEMPLRVFSTTNPSGAGRNWVKKRFIDAGPIGEEIIKSSFVFNPKTQQEEEIKQSKIAIFGSYRENIYLPPQYIAELNAISDPNKKAAWMYGDWNVASGGCFDDLWDPRVHIIKQFNIPNGWHVDRAFDWGSTHPFSVGWFAESNGEEFAYRDGTKGCFPKGTIIQIDEWYGTDEIGTNRGLKMSAPDIADGIKKQEADMLANGWVSSIPKAGPADNQISQTTQSDVDTIELKMARYGVKWTKSDKSKGSRVNGFQLFRDRLESSVRCEGQGFLIMSNCVASIEIIPTLARDEKKVDDVDTDSEEHIWDMVRYKVLDKPKRFARHINVSFSI